MWLHLPQQPRGALLTATLLTLAILTTAPARCAPYLGPTHCGCSYHSSPAGRYLLRLYLPWLYLLSRPRGVLLTGLHSLRLYYLLAYEQALWRLRR